MQNFPPSFRTLHLAAFQDKANLHTIRPTKKHPQLITTGIVCDYHIPHSHHVTSPRNDLHTNKEEQIRAEVSVTN